MTDTKIDTTIKDDWPQALVMSMGTLFLLAGLGVDIARFVASQDFAKRGALCSDAESGFFAAHPGLVSLGLGAALTLLGYFLPRKRAK